MTSSSLIYFRRTHLRIPKPKTQKKNPMRKHKVVPTKTQNKWLSVNEQVRLALNKDAVKATSVTQHKSVSEKFLANIERLKSGEFEAKRKQALSEYWQAKREKKAKSKAVSGGERPRCFLHAYPEGTPHRLPQPLRFQRHHLR